MYLHIGQNEILPDRRIIGIFDLDKCSYGKRTREYLAAAEQEGVVLDISGEIPKSFVVCDHPYHRQIVYLSQINAGEIGIAFAAAVIYMVPGLLMFLHGEAYLVEGITYAGSVKG